MKKICYLAVYVLFCAIFTGCSSAEKAPLKTDIPSAADKSEKKSALDPAARWRNIDLKKYPNANTILLDDIENVAYNKNGTFKRTEEYWTLIRTEKGRDDYRSVSVGYNEFYEKIPVVELEIIKPDGTVVKPLLQKKISVESSQMQSNIYDPANKVLSIGIPGVEVNDILHFKVTEEFIRPRMENFWSTISLLQNTEPVLRYSYTISAPENAPLAKIIVKDEVKGTLKRSVKKVNGRIIYNFTAENVPQIFPEPDMPPSYLHCMRILASTAPDWQSISRWYYNLCLPRMKAVSPELTAKAKSLAAGKSEAEAIRAMFDFVSKEIRYTGVTNENTAPGYEPHDVKDTFAQKHGVCRDKAALLAAMLREVGFDAFPVLFMAGDPKDPEVPNNYFNHAITGVKTSSGEIILMDATDENSADMLPAYAMNKSYLCATEKGDILRRSPVIPPEKNTLKIITRGVLDKDFTLKVQSRLTFGGFNDNIYRSAFAHWPKSYQEQFAASAIKRALPGATLEKIEVFPKDVRDLAKTFELILTYSVKDFVNIKWGAGTMELPFIGGNFGAYNFLVHDQLLKVRKYPMQFDSTAAVSEECSIVLPEKLELIAVPDYKNINTSALSAVFSVKKQGRTLTAQRNVKLSAMEIAVDEYKDFMQAVLDVKSADKNKLVVKNNFSSDKNAYAAAQAVILNEDTQVRFTGVDEISFLVSKEIKVLNYGGVKEYSELKLGYTENVSQARFISAKVILPGGKVIDVDLKTAKLMDLPISESAPRYPVVKQLILPLPGVVPGSIIKYSYAESCSGIQNSSFVKSLAGFLPIEKSKVEFAFPARRAGRFKVVVPESGFPVSTKEQGGMKIITVRSSSVPMYNDEPALPPYSLFAPFAGISSFNNTAYAEKLLAEFRKASENAPASSKLAAEFVRKYPDIRARVRAIRDYVAKNIRLAGVDVDVLGVKYITEADRTLREGYGNSFDRAILLYSLLKNAGVKNISVVLASSRPDLEIIKKDFTEMPQNIFSTALLRVTLENDEFYLGDTDEYAELGSTGFDNMLALDLATGELITVQSSAGCADETRQDWRIVCQKGNSAEITRTTCYYGMSYGAVKKLFDRITPEKERQLWEQELAGDLAGSEIIEIKKELDQYPGVITLKVKKPDFWKKSGQYIYFKLPASGAERTFRTAGKRTLPYWFNNTVKRSTNYEVDLMKDWKNCELIANSFSLALPGSDSTVQFESEMSEDMVLRAQEKIFVKPFYLDCSAYSVLENIQKELSNPGNRTILFKTSGK